MKKLPCSSLSFTKLRKEDKYYVDKSPFIKRVLEDDADVLLITRPRRFGKSLFMDMMYCFLDINPEKPGNATENAQLFSGLKILEDREFCAAYMGQFPVIALSLKDIDSTTFETAYRIFAGMLSKVARKFSFLLDSPRLSEEQKELLTRYKSLDYLKDEKNEDDLIAWLSNMVEIVSTHYERKVVVLIDEYDVPLAKASLNGYYKRMVSIIRGFLSTALKPDSTSALYLEKAVLTGCLRVSKESLFTGFNNPTINTVCSDDSTLSEAIGFTPSEVEALIRYYGLEANSENIRQWYDGYRFADSEMYCPWDLVNFCSDATRQKNPQTFVPKNYWINTSGNNCLDEFLGFLSGEDAEKMQTLLDGGTIDVAVNEQMNYEDFKQHNSQDFWTLLLFTGYLTIAERLPQSSTSFRLRIPNEEVRQTFRAKVLSRFSKENSAFVNSGKEIAQALLTGRTQVFRTRLTELLQNYVSVRDSATKALAENFYHGFLSAVFVSAGGVIQNFHSNVEAGNGYVDILFTSADESIGVIIEIKHCKKRDESIDLAKAALSQIKEKGYEQYFKGYPCEKIQAYGLVFFGKNCNVVMQSHEVGA